MDHPDFYIRAVEKNDGPNDDKVKTRTLRDSAGNWHRIEQVEGVWFQFDMLSRPGLDFDESSLKSPEITRGVMDEVVAETKRTSLPMSTCFMSVVMKRYNDAIYAEVDRRMAQEESKKDGGQT